MHGALHAIGHREDQRQVGEFRVFGRDRQAQAGQPFAKVERDMQCIAVFAVAARAIAFVAPPQRNQPPPGDLRGGAEGVQLARSDLRAPGRHGMAGERLEFDRLIEEAHGGSQRP